MTRHNETLLRQKADLEKRLTESSGRPLGGFHLSGEEERRIEDKVSEVLHRMVETKKSLETLRWLTESELENSSPGGCTFGDRHVRELPDVEDIATIRKAEAKLALMNQKLKEETEWTRGQRISSTPTTASRRKPCLDESSLTSGMTQEPRWKSVPDGSSLTSGMTQELASSPPRNLKQPNNTEKSQTFGSQDKGDPFKLGIKQGGSDCPATFIKKQKTIHAMVTTTYPDGTQSKGKEDVPEDYFVGKTEATQQNTEVLRTDNEADNEGDYSEGNMSGFLARIERLDSTCDTMGSDPREEAITTTDQQIEVMHANCYYWIKIDGEIVGNAKVLSFLGTSENLLQT